MTPEAQNQAIAEACGWTIEVLNGATYCWNDELNKTLPPEDDGMRDIPNYHGSLDAMHEAEKVLNDDQLYAMLLNVKNKTHSMVNGTAIMTATAAQRAEAFLRTLNLWTN